MYQIPMKVVETVLHNGQAFELNYPKFIINHIESDSSEHMTIGQVRLNLKIIDVMQQVIDKDSDMCYLEEELYRELTRRIENIKWTITSQIIVTFYDDIMEAVFVDPNKELIEEVPHILETEDECADKERKN